MDFQLLLLFPNAIFWLVATLRFYLIRDVGETSLTLQQSQTHTYISMMLLIVLAIIQAIQSTSTIGYVFMITMQQVVTYTAVIYLTRMHQTRNMNQSNYCTPMFVTLSLSVRLLIMVLERNPTPVEFAQLAIFSFLTLINFHRRRVEQAMKTLFFEELIPEKQPFTHSSVPPSQDLKQISPAQSDKLPQISVSLKPSIKIQDQEAWFQLQISHSSQEEANQYRVLLSVEKMIQLMQYVEATHKVVVSKLSEDLWYASSMTLATKVPLMQHMISSVEMYLQTILKKKEIVELDSQVLQLIGLRQSSDLGSETQHQRQSTTRLKVDQKLAYELPNQPKQAESDISFQDIQIIVKDYVIGKDGKPETSYTLGLKQVLNPLMSPKEIKLRIGWRSVKRLLKEFQLFSEVSEVMDKDQRIVKGVRILVVQLPMIQRQKFFNDYSLSLQTKETAIEVKEGSEAIVDDEDPFRVDFD